MSFDTILGQARPIGILQHAITSGRAHHAYLFAGPDGVGKRLVARAFAQALLCVHNNGDACGVCTHCARIAQDQHPDVLMLEPDRSKTRPIIKIDAIREITRQVHFKPYEGRRRVVLIDGAEAITEEGSNALLKTLEEPSGETLFVLITPQDRLLLTTIRSRCQLIRFAPLARGQVQEILLARGIDPQTAQVAAAFSEGSPGAALGLCEEGALEHRRELLQSVAELERGDKLAILSLAQSMANKGQELPASLDALQSFYRDVALVIAGAHAERVVNVDLKAAVERSAAELTLEQALGHIERIDQARRDLRGYIDARLVMENLLLALGT